MALKPFWFCACWMTVCSLTNSTTCAHATKVAAFKWNTLEIPRIRKISDVQFTPIKKLFNSIIVANESFAHYQFGIVLFDSNKSVQASTSQHYKQQQQPQQKQAHTYPRWFIMRMNRWADKRQMPQQIRKLSLFSTPLWYITI